MVYNQDFQCVNFVSIISVQQRVFHTINTIYCVQSFFNFQITHTDLTVLQKIFKIRLLSPPPALKKEN